MYDKHTELLFRLTQIDLRIFSGYITLQLAFGAWIAVHKNTINSPIIRFGLLFIDLALAVIAFALLYNNFRRRSEVASTVKNCNEAMGFETSGTYLDDRPLHANTKFRPWTGWYYTGIIVGFIGVVLIIIGA